MPNLLTGAWKDWRNATRARQGGLYFNFLTRTTKKGEGLEDGKGVLIRRKNRNSISHREERFLVKLKLLKLSRNPTLE